MSTGKAATAEDEEEITLWNYSRKSRTNRLRINYAIYLGYGELIEIRFRSLRLKLGTGTTGLVVQIIMILFLYKLSGDEDGQLSQTRFSTRHRAVVDSFSTINILYCS